MGCWLGIDGTAIPLLPNRQSCRNHSGLPAISSKRKPKPSKNGRYNMIPMPQSFKDKSVYFLFGALLALSKNSAKSFKTSFAEIHQITDLPHLNISVILNKLRSQGHLMFVEYEKDIYIQIPIFVNGVLESVNGY